MLIFQLFVSLLKLTMNNNEFKELPDELFTKTGCAVKAIFLKGNKLNFVNQKVFQNCTSLRYLFLADNLITKVPPKLLQVTVYSRRHVSISLYLEQTAAENGGSLAEPA